MTVEPVDDVGLDGRGVDVVVRFVVAALVDAELDVGRATGPRVVGEGDRARGVA